MQIIYTTSNNSSDTISNIPPQQIISSSELLSTIAIWKRIFHSKHTSLTGSLFECLWFKHAAAVHDHIPEHSAAAHPQ
jgi:hypothetical protein